MRARPADLTDHKAFLRTAYLASGAHNLEEFSEMIGVNRRNVRRWQTGTKPAADTLKRIARFIEDTVDPKRTAVLYGTEQRPVYVLDERFYIRTECFGIPQIYMMGLNFSGQKAVAMETIPFVEYLYVHKTPQTQNVHATLSNWTPPC